VGATPLAQAEESVRDAAPDVEMPAGVLLTGTGELLWSREPDEPRPMASTTKIMTCLLVLESAELGEEVTVSSSAARVGGSGIYLQGGEVRTVDELLHALLLESSNAAAAALAEHVAGSVSGFVEMMNERAEELGLEQTSFRNPHGLDADGHHTSAQDLAELTQVAMESEVFAEIVATSRTSIGGPYGDRALENSNDLIGTYEGATGVKTGWTNPAGYCLVGSASREDVELIAVVLGAEAEQDRFVQTRRLLDWGFEHYVPVTLASEEETVAQVRVSDRLDSKVWAGVDEGAEAYVLDLEGPIVREWELAAWVESPVARGQRLGTLRAYQGDELLGEVPLVAMEDVAEPDWWERVRVFFSRLWDDWFGPSETAPVGA
jgi:D-alanyl-D-alanine carboxypeptidase (penicillin-binding protein 5/6)